jgi:hypothetical protein
MVESAPPNISCQRNPSIVTKTMFSVLVCALVLSIENRKKNVTAIRVIL